MSSVPEIKPSTFITLSVKDSDGVRITRTMRSTDKLRNLTDFYLAMVSAYGRCASEGIFMHYGRTMRGERSLAECDLKDGDEITFFMIISRRSESVTLKIKAEDGCSFIRTIGRNDRLQDITEFYYANVPTAKYGGLMYKGRQVDDERSPLEYLMEDGDEITFFLISKKSLFVTLKVKGEDGCIFTRTIGRTDRLQDLIDFHNAMVPNAENDDFMYNGKQVEGSKSPSDYKMDDGDQLVRCHRDMFVTVSVEGTDNFWHTHTLRRTDKLQGLMDLCSSIVIKGQRLCDFIFDGDLVRGSQTPDDLKLKNGDKISMFFSLSG
ncbi:hypothetical protein ABZP36_000354 [Zizania latifolia]